MRSLTVAISLLLLGACATGTRQGSLPPSRPPSSAERSLGYQDAIDLGADYVAQQGYAEAELQGAKQVQPNVWCVRFGLAPKQSGNVLELYFDSSDRALLKATEMDGRGNALSTTKNVP